MSPTLPVVSGDQAVKALVRGGFTWVGQRGSHVKLRRHQGTEVSTVIVPLHTELAAGTLRSILRQAGWTVDQFVALL